MNCDLGGRGDEGRHFVWNSTPGWNLFAAFGMFIKRLIVFTMYFKLNIYEHNIMFIDPFRDYTADLDDLKAHPSLLTFIIRCRDVFVL